MASEHPDRDLEPFARRPVLTVAAAAAAVLLAVSWRYGYHRDELYYLAASRHMAWGYVDQPPLVVWWAWVARVAGGSALPVLRLPPALALGGLAVIGALIARELGAQRFGQVFA